MTILCARTWAWCPLIISKFIIMVVSLTIPAPIFKFLTRGAPPINFKLSRTCSSIYGGHV